MTDDATAEAWLDSLQEMLEQNLIETGYISEATREFFNLMGYDDRDNPSYGNVRDYVMALSERMGVSPTEDLDALEKEYQTRHYTHRCLQFGLPAGYCLVGASEYGHLDVVNASLRVPESRGYVESAMTEAIDGNHLDVVKALDPYILPRDPEESDEDYRYRVEDVFYEILGYAADKGRLEILKHELDHALSYDYRPDVYNLLINAAHSRSAPTLEFVVTQYPNETITYIDSMVGAAAGAGDVNALVYLQAWSRSRPGVEPLTSAKIILNGVGYEKPDILDAFIDDVSAAELSSVIEELAAYYRPVSVEFFLSYLGERGLAASANLETIITAGIKRRDEKIVEAALAFADEYGHPFQPSDVRAWVLGLMRPRY